jgi:O-antigen ligase
MNQQALRRSPIYLKAYKMAISWLSFVYVVSAFGFIGVPSLSRLALYSATLLLFLVLVDFHKLRIPPWAIAMIVFYAFITVPSLALEKPSYEKLGKVIAAFMGFISIGLALRNKLLSYEIVVYGTLIAAILNVIAVQMGIDTAPVASEGRYSGFMANPNSLSIAMALAGFMVWLFPERFRWPIRLLGTFLALYGMYVSGSRKGLLLSAMLLLLIFINKLVQLDKLKLILYGSGIISAIIGLYTWISLVIAKYSTNILAIDRLLEGLKGHERSFSGRLSFIDRGITLWKESPFFGHGFDQFASMSGFGRYAHNNYIELAVAGGLIGLILFYSSHSIIIRNAMKQPMILRLRLLIFLAAILVMDMAVVSFYEKAITCTLGTLLAVSSDQVPSNDTNGRLELRKSGPYAK